MMTKREVERVEVLAGRAQAGKITAENKGEMRALLAKQNPIAMDLSWEDLMTATYFFLGVYSLARIATEPDAQAAAP